ADSPTDSASGQEPAETGAAGSESDEVATAGESADGAPMSASEALLQELESAEATRSGTRNKTNSSKAGTSTSSGSRGRKAATAKTATSKTGSAKTGNTKASTARTAPAGSGASKKTAAKASDSGTARTGSTSTARAATPAENTPEAARKGSGQAAAPQQTPEGLQPVPGATFAEVPIESLSANANQPRQVFDDDEMNELASSIREVGVLQPVVVRPWGTDADGQPAYELIMGERRWRAARIAGQDTIPAIIRETAHEDMLRDALLENLHRVQLNPLEEAAAYQQLLEDFGCTHDELAVRIARSRPQISNTLRLLKLPPMVQRRVAAGILSAGHARALLGLTDGAAMERLAQRIVAEGLSVRATEEIIAMGDEPMQPEMRRRPRDSDHAVALNELAGRLSDNLDTKVKVKLGQRKGHVSIEFAGVADLNRILAVLAPSDPGVGEAEGGSEDAVADGAVEPSAEG